MGILLVRLDVHTIQHCRFTAPLENVEMKATLTRNYRRRKGKTEVRWEERKKEKGKRERENERDRVTRSRGGDWTFYARRAKDAFESLIPFETLILGAKWRERGVFFGWMTYWASFVCHCVRGRLIQTLWPLICVIRITFSLFSFLPVEETYESGCPFLFLEILFSLVVFQQYTLATENATSSVIRGFSFHLFYRLIERAISQKLSLKIKLAILLLFKHSIIRSNKISFGARFFVELFNFLSKFYCYLILYWE